MLSYCFKVKPSLTDNSIYMRLINFTKYLLDSVKIYNITFLNKLILASQYHKNISTYINKMIIKYFTSITFINHFQKTKLFIFINYL